MATHEQDRYAGMTDTGNASSFDSHNGAKTRVHGSSDNSFNPQEPGRPWGSLGSWINTAVSTVNEVIENPNVVVSRAHTISQGIRSVATEQIDRVYESLDPEYDYERERQKQQQQQQYPTQPYNQTQLQHQQQQSTPQQDQQQLRQQSLFQPKALHSQPPRQTFTPPSREAFNKGDISDLLGPSRLSGESTTRTIVVDREASVSAKVATPLAAYSQSKLAYKEEDAKPSGDDWGDDAWGDDWSDPIAKELSEAAPPEPTMTVRETALTPVQDTTKFEAAMPVAQNIPEKESKELEFQSTSNRLSPTADTRSVKGLFSSPQPDNTNTPQTSRASSSLAVLSPFGDQSRSDQQRRPSTDLRPAEALFSTLDFASNAIGSAVLGVHRKVTQSSQSQTSRGMTASPSFQYTRPASPTWSDTPQEYSDRESSGSKIVSARKDRSAMANPSLEGVGGNVVSTGLGALEILGKKAVDVISDVRRAGHLQQGHGGLSEQSEDGIFKVPSRMNFASLFDAAGGRVHLGQLRYLASSATARTSTLTAERMDLLKMGQLDELEVLLSPQMLDSAVDELSADLMAGHKDFRAMVALLEKMGVQGTTHLRHLRNCTRKLSSLVPDSVNAFEQEWHNHQSRASEKDFFARAPIKKFFESSLLSVYFDGLRALAQFTDRTCDQALKIAENSNLRVAEKSGNSAHSAKPLDGDRPERPPPLILAQIMKQFIGSLIAETKFIAKTYHQTLEAILQAAQQFTTPLDRLDWEDLSMGTDNIKILLITTDVSEAVGFIHSGSQCILDVMKNELILDALQGQLVPKPRSSQPKQQPVTPEPRGQSQSALQTRTTATPPHSALNTSKSSLSSQPTRAAVTPVLRPNDANAVGSQSPSMGSAQTPSRPTSSLAQHPKVLKDEDFFSILNDR
ncbi:hypothetical protein BG011_004339 [Mortierella polycephala]|uniref:Uncharacterized protein n=1 Tax=Mortierella polycephala TaxID=41804 RepID=A0A9P6PYI8_9FUNG|nr:hypothetical protein BG011_004339 [Mortierella polycephala]